MNVRKWAIRLAIATSLIAGYGLVHDRLQPKIISADFGGSIGEYIESYADIRHSKVKIRIEDYCISACTMVLGLIPRDRVCADDRALFGFHSAWFMGPFGPVFSREGTRLVWNLYPKAVQDDLRARGWDGEGNEPHPELIYVPATKFLPKCDG